MSQDVIAFERPPLLKSSATALAALLAALDCHKSDIDAVILATEPGKTAIGLDKEGFPAVFGAAEACKEAFGLEFLPFYNAVREWVRGQYGEEITIDFTYTPRLILQW